MGFEDLYDVPPTEVQLAGGPHDGKRFLVPDDRDTWLVPNEPPSELGFPSLYPANNFTTYRFTGSITDDGLRIFRAV